MACGDGNNDLMMLKEVGFGVAMANGADEVKEVADYITSVSYTHLDVYKRQVQSSVRTGPLSRMEPVIDVMLQYMSIM